jgi:hypothetical protein
MDQAPGVGTEGRAARRGFAWLGIAAGLLIGCADDQDPGLDCVDPGLSDAGTPCVQVPYSVAGHETIASEEGLVALLSGRVVLERLSLFEGDREVVWIRDQVFDLEGSGGRVLVEEPLPPGTYGRMEIVLGRASSGEVAFEGDIQRAGEPPLHVVYDHRLVGDRFPDPALVIDGDNGAAVELPISLAALFFYTWPYLDAQDGVLRIDGAEQARGNFEANLLNLWNPRLAP